MRADESGRNRLNLVRNFEKDQRRRRERTSLFLYSICIFFDHRVGENLGCDSLNMGAGGFGGEAIGKREGEILALAHGGNFRETYLAQGVLDGLALRIEDRSLQRDIDMRLHFP
jgi:hypothetical protein